MMIPDVELVSVPWRPRTCPYLFLSQHYITKHPELYCRACASIFKTKAKVEVHYRDTRGHNACSLCNVSFGTTKSYRGVRTLSQDILWLTSYVDSVQHMTTNHIQKLVVAQCITCDKYYKSDDTLFAHIAAAHEGGDLDVLSRPLRYTGPSTVVRACIPLVRTM